MSVDNKIIIEDMFEKSNTDKYGGMSLLSEFIDFYTLLDSNDKNDMVNTLLELINDYNNNKIITLSWLLAGLSSNDIYIPGALEMLEARIMREYYKKCPCVDFISSIEKDVKIIRRNLSERNGTSMQK